MKIVRWILFLPVAVVSAIVGSVLFQLVASLSGNQAFVGAVDTAVFGFVCVFVAGLVAPSHRHRVRFVLATLLVGLCSLGSVLTAFGVQPFVRESLPQKVLECAAQAAGVICALYVMRRNSTSAEKGVSMSVQSRRPSGILVGLFAVMMIGVQFGGLALHFWTIVLALRASGVLAGFITFTLPIVSEIYWFLRTWKATGTLTDPYCAAALAYVALVVVTGALASWGDEGGESSNEASPVNPEGGGVPPTP